MFLQIHTLTAYPASLLNRDDAGLAKRIPFGESLKALQAGTVQGTENVWSNMAAAVGSMEKRARNAA